MLAVRTIAPYLVWMAFLLAGGPSPAGYAARTAVTAAVLLFAFKDMRRLPSARDFLLGALVGGIVFAVWVAPEGCAWYRRWFVLGEGGTEAIAQGGAALKAVRLIGSAFVIAPAEELFFRSFLYRWLQRRDWFAVSPRTWDLSAFLWTTALFALEHDRWAVGAFAGAVYGLVFIRRGLGAAIAAHMTTNLVLGLYVLRTGAWALW